MSPTSTQVRLLTSDDASDWYQSGEREIFLADVLDAAGGASMTVGFARYGAGESNRWTLSYDEALVITKGTFTVRSATGDTTARAGEVIFLTKGVEVVYHADEAAELVYVTFPHWAEATRRSPHAALLDTFHPVGAAKPA